MPTVLAHTLIHDSLEQAERTLDTHEVAYVLSYAAELWCVVQAAPEMVVSPTASLIK